MVRQNDVELKKWCIDEAKLTMCDRIIVIPIINNKRMNGGEYYKLIMKRAKEIYRWTKGDI